MQNDPKHPETPDSDEWDPDAVQTALDRAFQPVDTKPEEQQATQQAGQKAPAGTNADLDHLDAGHITEEEPGQEEATAPSPQATPEALARIGAAAFSAFANQPPTWRQPFQWATAAAAPSIPPTPPPEANQPKPTFDWEAFEQQTIRDKARDEAAREYLSLQNRIASLETEISDHHQAIQQLAEQRKTHREAMNNATEERAELLARKGEVGRALDEDTIGQQQHEGQEGEEGQEEGEGQGQPLPPGMMAAGPHGRDWVTSKEYERDVERLKARGKAAPGPTNAPAGGQQGRPPRQAATPTPASAPAPAAQPGQDPADSADLAVLKISPGRLEKLRAASVWRPIAGLSTNCRTVADLETLIRAGHLQNVIGIGAAAVDAITDALIAWREKHPAPQPPEPPGQPGQEQPEGQEEGPAGRARKSQVEVPPGLDLEEENNWWAGFWAGKKWLPVGRNPHRIGSRLWRCWDAGWQEGNAVAEGEPKDEDDAPDDQDRD